MSPDDRPITTDISRRAFTLGSVGAFAAGSLIAGAPSAGAVARDKDEEPFFDEVTMWDSLEGPRVNYHVHGLTVLADDTILVATEGRFEVCDAGPRELLMRRSVDGGQTWTQSTVLHPSVDGESWGNPTFVADLTTGTVFCFFMLSIRLPENTSCSGDIGDLYMKSSSDGGQTWSQAQDISGMFEHFPYDWALHGPGPGHGIQLSSGRLLLQVSHRRVIVGNTVDQRFYGVSTLYSDDHGQTWQAGGEIPVSVDYPLGEARLMELADGRVMINARASAGGNRHRIVSISDDGGLTWAQPRLEGGTGTFNSVDAALVRYSGGPGSADVNRVLYSKPDAPVRRVMTVYVSYDEGRSLRYARVINENRAYYSDLARLSDGTIVLLYGCDGDIPSAPRRVALARFNLAWLTQGQDTGPNTVRSSQVTLVEAPVAVSDMAVDVVEDPLALAGSRVELVAGGPEAWAEFEFEASRVPTTEVWLRYYRPAGGAVFRVTVDGEELGRVSHIDASPMGSEGYDIAYLGERRLHPRRRHTLRVTLDDAEAGAGARVSLDALVLVKAVAEPDLRNEVVVDNLDRDFAVVSGTWGAGRTGTQGVWNSNYRHHPAGDGSSVLRWRPVVPRSGRYEIQSSILPFPNRATDAPFRIDTGSGEPTTVRIDQTVDGVWDARGTQWQSLGEFELTGGRTLSVDLSDDANGYVAGDAIRIVRL